jgi:hypothetical protein
MPIASPDCGQTRDTIQDPPKTVDTLLRRSRCDAHVGGRALAELALQLEEGSTPDDMETAGSILGHLRAELTRLRVAMEAAGLFHA